MNKENLNGCGCGCGENEQGSGCGCGEHEHEHNHEHGDSCGCDCGDHEPLVVDLEDENGNVVACEVVDGFEYKDNEYAIVQHPENEAIFLFKVVGEGEEGELVIPDDQEFEEVSAYYEQLMSEEE